MSYYDESATRTTTAQTDEATATGDSRSLWGWLAIAGVGLCFTPIIVLGVGMAISFGLLWLCAPVVETLEQETIEDVRETGGGVGKFIQTVMLMVFFGALAIGLALFVMLAVMTGVR